MNRRQKHVFDVEVEARVIDGVVKRYPLFFNVGGRARGEKQLQRDAVDKGESYWRIEEYGLVRQWQIHLLRQEEKKRGTVKEEE